MRLLITLFLVQLNVLAVSQTTNYSRDQLRKLGFRENSTQFIVTDKKDTIYAKNSDVEVQLPFYQKGFAKVNGEEYKLTKLLCAQTKYRFFYNCGGGAFNFLQAAILGKINFYSENFIATGDGHTGTRMAAFIQKGDGGEIKEYTYENLLDMVKDDATVFSEVNKMKEENVKLINRKIIGDASNNGFNIEPILHYNHQVVSE